MLLANQAIFRILFILSLPLFVHSAFAGEATGASGRRDVKVPPSGLLNRSTAPTSPTAATAPPLAPNTPADSTPHPTPPQSTTSADSTPRPTPPQPTTLVTH